MAASRKNQASAALAAPSRRSPLAVQLRNVPAGWNWGWFSREDPRMHLQPVDAKHVTTGFKVWLEDRGRRVLQPEGEIPAKVLRQLAAELPKHRQSIEDDWTRFMLQKDWVILSLTGSVITVVAYPHVPGSGFARTLDLADHLPALYHPESQLVARERRPVRPEEVGLSKELCAIEIYPQLPEGRRHHLYLPPILWQD